MKGKLRKGIALLGITALTAAALAGCGSGKMTDNQQAAGASASVAETAAEAKDSDTAALNKRDENGNYVGPLCEEQKELSIFFAIGGANFSGAQTFTQEVIDNNPSYQKLSENTNIKINYIIPATGEEEAQFNLLIASGNYPDTVSYTHLDVYKRQEVHTFAGVPHGQGGITIVGEKTYPNFQLWLQLADVFLQDVFQRQRQK